MSKKITGWLRLAALALWTGIFMIQFIYAVGWAVQNGNNIQDFYDTAVYLRSAQEFTGDGWHLLGYACILRWFQGLTGIIGDSYVVVLYLVQTLCSLAAFTYGVKVVSKVIWNHNILWWKAGVIALYLVTLPVIWQLQFALLPDAFCLALLVLLFSQLLEILFQHKMLRWERMWILCGVCLLLGITHYHSFYAASGLILIAVGILLIKQIRKEYRSRNGILAAVFLVVILGLTALIGTGVNESIPKAEPYAKHTVVAELWSRFVFPHLQEDYAFYPEEVKQVFPEEVLLKGSEYYEFYLSEVIPYIETKAGDNTSDMCKNMVITSFQLHRNEAIKSFLKESIAYGFIPLFMEKYMYENSGSLYGHNLMKMWEKAPELTVDYMHISMNGFLIVCCFGIVLLLFEWISGIKRLRHVIKAVLTSGFCIAGAIVPMMVFSFEKFDYRIGLFSFFIWGVMTVSLIMGQEWRKDNERKYNKDVEK